MRTYYCLRMASTLSLIAAVAGLIGCATPQPAPTPAPAPAPELAVAAPVPAPAPAPAAPAATPAPVRSIAPAPSAGASALREGITAFSQGEYKRAETKLLDSQKLGLNQTSEQVQAHKTKAFLYCVTRRTALCEQSFAAAFEADSTFNLTRAERGHPVWGPVFTKVQKRQPK